MLWLPMLPTQRPTTTSSPISTPSHVRPTRPNAAWPVRMLWVRMRSRRAPSARWRCARSSTPARKILRNFWRKRTSSSMISRRRSKELSMNSGPMLRRQRKATHASPTRGRLLHPASDGTYRTFTRSHSRERVSITPSKQSGFEVGHPMQALFGTTRGAILGGDGIFVANLPQGGQRRQQIERPSAGLMAARVVGKLHMPDGLPCAEDRIAQYRFGDRHVVELGLQI